MGQPPQPGSTPDAQQQQQALGPLAPHQHHQHNPLGVAESPQDRRRRLGRERQQRFRDRKRTQAVVGSAAAVVGGVAGVGGMPLPMLPGAAMAIAQLATHAQQQGQISMDFMHAPTPAEEHVAQQILEVFKHQTQVCPDYRKTRPVLLRLHT